MNIHSKKQLWKYSLGVVALLIVTASFWYTSRLAKKIELEERSNVRLWAEAIQKKAKLVRYTNELFTKLAIEERKKVELWAEATKKLGSENTIVDYSFVLKVVADNTTVPVILVDDIGKVISHRNLDENTLEKESIESQMQEMGRLNPPIEISIYGDKKNYLYFKDSKIFSELRIVLDDIVESFISEIVLNSASAPVLFMSEDREVISFGNIDSAIVSNPSRLQQILEEMSSQNEPIRVDLSENRSSYVYYQDSELLTRLQYYPYVQFGIIGIFILVSYWLFSIARKSEQNQVWVGLAKETAHQLGTPLSSLMAWMELLKTQGVDQGTTTEMSKDIQRLEMITDRFSKIGSTPKLDSHDIYQVLHTAISYIKDRSSNRVHFIFEIKDPIFTELNTSLFSWVVENLCKNAIDAMNGNGTITISVGEKEKQLFIDVKDTGKGIPSAQQKAVFQPGYTTKKRGWGLGLSLAKRIIETYHNGKIFVKQSTEGQGTTFRITLNKQVPNK